MEITYDDSPMGTVPKGLVAREQAIRLAYAGYEEESL